MTYITLKYSFVVMSFIIIILLQKRRKLFMTGQVRLII